LVLRKYLTSLVGCLAAILALGVQASELEYAPNAPKSATSTLIDIDRAGGRLVAVGERGHVLYSDDKGQSWQQGKMPFRRMLTGVDFIDAQRGWAVGHQSMIFHTRDGGETWERQIDGFVFQHQYNQDNVIRTRETYQALRAELDANPDPDRDLELEDALFAFEDAEFALEEPAIPTNFHDVWFMNKHNGWAVGAFGRMAETHDGGKTWTDKSHLISTPDGFHLNSITGTANGEIFIAGESGVVFRSLDRGAHWEQMDVGYYGTFFGVTYDPTRNMLRVFGLGSALYQSANQGASWQRVKSPVAATFASGISTADGSTILVGPGGMVLVIDGSTQFIQPHPQPGRRNYSAAVSISARELIVVGQGGPTRVSLE
jgi:photosystem II stability/assembly factor-like uncharacterized protein